MSDHPECACPRYAAPLETAEEADRRYKVSRTLMLSLDRLAATDDDRFRLYRCRSCGQHWQESCAPSRRDALYQVPPVDPQRWRQVPLPDQALIVWWRSIFHVMGPEVGPEPCREPGCNRRRAHLSVFCAMHHCSRNLGLKLLEPSDTPEEYRGSDPGGPSST